MHCVRPILDAVHACRKISKYLSLTKHLGLQFFPDNIRLACFDSLALLILSTSKSLLVVLLNFLVIHQFTGEKNQANTKIPLSTAEAEYVAAHVAGKEIMAIPMEMKCPQHSVICG